MCASVEALAGVSAATTAVTAARATATTARATATTARATASASAIASATAAAITATAAAFALGHEVNTGACGVGLALTAALGFVAKGVHAALGAQMRVGAGLEVVVLTAWRARLVVTWHARFKVAWGTGCVWTRATVVELACGTRALALGAVTVTRWALAVAVAAHMAVGAWGTAFAVTAFTARCWATATASAATTARGAFGVTDALHHFVARCFGSGGHHVAAWGLAQTTPQGLTAHGNGFGSFIGLGTKPFHDDDGHLLLGEVLNVFHEAFFVQGH